MIKKIKDWFNHERNKKDNFWIFIGMLVGALASLLASFVLSVQAVQLAANPETVLSCSINATVNCVSVALHPTASLFGFPNSFLGMIAEPVVITVAVAGLMGVVFPRLFMFIAQIVYSLGFIFAYVLLYISVFTIQVLCPWCLLVTLSTTLVFFSITRYNIRENNLYLPPKAQKTAKKFIDKNYDRLVLFSLLAAVIAFIIFKYGADLFA